MRPGGDRRGVQRASNHFGAVIREQSRRSLATNSSQFQYRCSYILYRPRSSSERPSSHLRSSSLVDFSEMALEILELFRTSSSTKMGQSTRRASARASLGRESMEKISPLRSTQISA